MKVAAVRMRGTNVQRANSEVRLHIGQSAVFAPGERHAIAADHGPLRFVQSSRRVPAAELQTGGITCRSTT